MRNYQSSESVGEGRLKLSGNRMSLKPSARNPGIDTTKSFNRMVIGFDRSDAPVNESLDHTALLDAGGLRPVIGEVRKPGLPTGVIIDSRTDLLNAAPKGRE